MYTTIAIDEDAQGAYFDRIRLALAQATDKRQKEVSPGVFAEYSPDGLAVKLSTRVLRLPEAFEGVRIVRVTIEHVFYDATMKHAANKKVVRRRSRAAVSTGLYQDTQYLTVWGDSLQAANRLYQDILDNKVTWC